MRAVRLDWTAVRRLNLAGALVVGVLGLVSGVTQLESRDLLASQGTVTLTGCLERDAASRVAIYKLATTTSTGTAMYRLTATGTINLEADLGHTVEVTGALTARDPSRPREEPSIAVQTLKRVADRCS